MSPNVTSRRSVPARWAASMMPCSVSLPSVRARIISSSSIGISSSNAGMTAPVRMSNALCM
jgi:hypothetical protein